jgi:ERCC4-type nuclease
MILVDSRFGPEGSKRSSHRAVADALMALGFEVEITTLGCGDFAFLGNGPDGPIQIGIELKVIGDLVNSMRSGRLAEQVTGMSEVYGRTYLIVEGLYRVGRKSGQLEVPRGRGYRPLLAGPRPVLWADIEKFVTGLEEAGVRVRRTRSSYETALVIARVLQGFWAKEYAAHRSLQVLHAPTPPMTLVREDKATRRLRLVASCLPAIGWGRSKAVAEAFRSIAGLATAGVDQWEQIEGIGKTIARDCFEAVRVQIPSPPRVPARVVSQRDRVAAGSTRDLGKCSSNRLDSARLVKRRFSENRASSRGARRGVAERSGSSNSSANRTRLGR